MQLSGLSTKFLIVLIKICPPLVQEVVVLIFHCMHNILDKNHTYSICLRHLKHLNDND